MEKKLIIKGLVFGTIILFIGISVIPILNTAGYPTNSMVEWYENFDDGNLDGWTILNPEKPGDQPITLQLTTNQSHSPQYSMLWNSPHTGSPDYSARAYGPNVPLNVSKPYTVEFWFRWNAFHWVHLAAFGYLETLIDYPSLSMNFMDDDGYHYLGPAFNTYCPSNTWTQFKFEVNPSDSTITLVVDGNTIVTFNYKMATPSQTKFSIRDPGAGASDYFDHCYYDDIKISTDTTPPDCRIVKPRQGFFYLRDIETFPTPFGKTIIFLRITVQIEASDAQSGIKEVRVIIDGTDYGLAVWNPLTHYYEYIWDETAFGKRTLSCMAIDNSGYITNCSGFPVWYFNLKIH